MTSTFTVKIELDSSDPESLLSEADAIESALIRDGFDVIEVNPWSKHGDASGNLAANPFLPGLSPDSFLAPPTRNPII